MAIGKFRKGARPRTRWWQPWWLVRTGGRGWLLPCDTCTQRLCGTQHSCACVYKLCERDWHAIEINRCGCVMATISNIRGGGYCEIDCTRFFSPLSFFPFFFLPFHMITTSTIVYGENSSERKEAGARYLCGRSSALWARQWKPSSICTLYVQSRCALWIISSGIRGVHPCPRNLLEDSDEWWVLSLSLVEVEMVLKGWLLMVDAEDYFRQMYDLYVRVPEMLYSIYISLFLY